jgi:hypothetical protein
VTPEERDILDQALDDRDEARDDRDDYRSACHDLDEMNEHLRSINAALRHHLRLARQALGLARLELARGCTSCALHDTDDCMVSACEWVRRPIGWFGHTGWWPAARLRPTGRDPKEE